MTAANPRAPAANASRTLHTARLHLEPLTESHAFEMYDALQDERIYAFIPDRRPAAPDELRLRYRRLATGVSSDGTQRWLNWIVRLVAKSQCIGYVQSTVYPAGTADFAFVIASAFWGQGIAREASLAAIDALRDDWGVHSLHATVDSANHRSCALLLRLGFAQVAAATYPHGTPAEGDRVFARPLVRSPAS